jgi:hypothetical protein
MIGNAYRAGITRNTPNVNYFFVSKSLLEGNL